MGNLDLISILMPTYNVENYVEEAVKSILIQTYTNFELIIVDDCSSDNTYRILQKLAATEKRIRLYRNSENRKICKTLNFALYKSRGKYIARMDGDDISTPDRLEKLKKYLDEHTEIALVGSQMIGINESGEEISRKKLLCTDAFIKKANKFLPAVTHIWLARIEIYHELHGYRDIPYAEDYDFLLRGESSGFRYANVDEYLYKCRIRKGNTVSANGLVQRKTTKYVKRLYKKEKISKKDLFDDCEFTKYIECNDVQKKRYQGASEHLNTAISNKENMPFMVLHTIIASAMSAYMFDYLINAAKFRLLIRKENALLSQK